MYYKIVNKKSEVYQKLHKLRTSEIQIEKDNIVAINEKVGLKWKSFLGDHGQQNFRRVKQFSGFKFLEPEKVDLTIWKHDKDYEGVFIPNRKTKQGREMANFLLNGLKGSFYNTVFEILKVETFRRFQLPYVEIAGEVIVICLGSEQEPKSKDVIEITKCEFNQLLK